MYNKHFVEIQPWKNFKYEINQVLHDMSKLNPKKNITPRTIEKAGVTCFPDKNKNVVKCIAVKVDVEQDDL